MADWREQYLRMLRWRYRLWLGVEHVVGGGDQAVVDVFFAFAQACYHLLDWFKNDPTQRTRLPRLDLHVASSNVLRHCGAICNGSKHAQLQSKKVQIKLQKTTTPYSIKDESGQSQEFVANEVQLFVWWKDEFIAADTFAGLCVEEWNRFLSDEQLLPPAAPANPRPAMDVPAPTDSQQ